MTNKEYAKEIDTAVALLSTLSVSGEVVDLIAAVKSKLRRVSEELTKEEEENSNG